MTPNYLYRTFEFVGPDDGDATIEIRITFGYRPGTRRSHPGGHWNSHIGTWDPPSDDEREFIRAERETDPNKWVLIADSEWLHTWCVAAFEAADADDLVLALPEWEGV